MHGTKQTECKRKGVKVTHPSGNSFGSRGISLTSGAGGSLPRSREMRLMTIWPLTESLSSLLALYKSNF